MKLLVITQRFWPESFRINDLVKELVRFGLDITVVTGLPMYPKGYIFNEYKNGKNRFQSIDGIKIIRVKEFERKNNIFNRILNYYSYSRNAKRYLEKCKDSFDIVLVNELSPIMSAAPGIFYAKKHSKKILMYEMDLWPESLLAGGITKRSLIYKYYKKVSAKIYSQCDKILVSTEDHINYIKSLPGCSNLEIEYLPQYAEEQFNEVSAVSTHNGLNLMFAGNIGKAQSVETILKAAELLKEKNIKFHIVGDGSEYKNIKTIVEDLKLINIVLYGKKPLEEMPELYSKADAMMVTLEDSPYANMTVPGKVQSYMAAGKMVIGCVNGATQNLINDNGIGVCCNAGDYKKLAEIINNITPEDVAKYGKKSREVYQELFNKDKFIKKLESELEKLAKN